MEAVHKLRYFSSMVLFKLQRHGSFYVSVQQYIVCMVMDMLSNSKKEINVYPNELYKLKFYLFFEDVSSINILLSISANFPFHSN